MNSATDLLDRLGMRWAVEDAYDALDDMLAWVGDLMDLLQHATECREPECDLCLSEYELKALENNPDSRWGTKGYVQHRQALLAALDRLVELAGAEDA